MEDFVEQEWDYVETVCDRANEACPFFPGGKEKIHRGFEDPASLNWREEDKLALFRRVKDDIKTWIEDTFK